MLRRSDLARFSVDDWLTQAVESFSYNGRLYQAGIGTSAPYKAVEEPDRTFGAYIQAAYRSNGVVFATILARLLLFTEARLTWQELNDGRPGDLTYSPELGILERPWPNGTTGELLARAEQDVSLSGTFYVARARSEPNRLRRLRPDWTEVILTAPPAEATRSDVAGYMYYPGGPGSGHPGQPYTVREVASWCPIPDPEAQYRGMSWLTPVIREVQADKAATEHKLAFFRNGAKPGLVFSTPESVTVEQFREFVEAANEASAGTENAYKSLFVGAGASVTVAGADLRQLDFKNTQGAGETRITAAGGVPAVIVGLSEGLQAATYSNYGQAKRKFGDHWARPQWRSFCAAMQTILDVPENHRLWYDDRDIAFLREDAADAAIIQQTRAGTINALITAGYTPESSVEAVMGDDFGLLKHSGLVSVQLQPPGEPPKAPSQPTRRPPDGATLLPTDATRSTPADDPTATPNPAEGAQ